MNNTFEKYFHSGHILGIKKKVLLIITVLQGAFFSTAISSQEILWRNRSGIGNLVDGNPQNAHFGKSFFLLVETFQHVVYGYENENYDFTYWLGPVLCGPGYSSECDDRACAAVPGGTSYCDKTENPPFCKCDYKNDAGYMKNCDPPQVVLDFYQIYYGAGGNPETAMRMGVQLFVTTCTFVEGQTEPPMAPEPQISMVYPVLADGTDGIEVVISITQFYYVPGMTCYYWAVITVSVRIHEEDLSAILEKIGTPNLAKLLNKRIVNEIGKLQHAS